GALRTPASISTALRELIAASTSWQNQCAFCTQAHAAAAAELLGSEELVWSVLTDLEASPLEPREKALLRFTSKITKNLPGVTREDVDEVRASGWDDEAIYYAITTCALFNFYNRWITATGVPEMSREAHRLQGQNLARHGYVRGENK
ncbi:MAG: peroxidase-related enzyme, partial [Acidobacteriota bacterium]